MRRTKSATRHLQSLARIEDALALIGTKSKKVRGTDRDKSRSDLLILEKLYRGLAEREANRVYQMLRTAGKAKASMANGWDEVMFRRAAEVAGYRNVMAGIAQLLADTFDEEFCRKFKTTVDQATTDFQDELIKRYAAEAVARDIGSEPLPTDKTGLN